MSDVTAALITAKETVTFRRFSQAPPQSGCVTVDISLCGICGTDIASFRSGHLHSPAVCGHEWVGTVADAGAGVDDLQQGDRVVLAVPPPCGRCPECRRGLGEYCRTASLVARGRDPLAPPHGGFAGSISVQATRVMRAHPHLSDEVAAQVEPATVALHGVRRSGITAGDTVVVQGAGPIGLFALQFARAVGAGNVVVVEPSPARRRLATELGAVSAVAPGEAAGCVEDHTHGIGADVVIECAGIPRLLQTAVDLARSGGVVQLLSFLAEPATINAAQWLARQVTVVASNAFTHDDFRRSMTFLADGRVRAQPLHSRTVRLDELEVTLRGLSAGPSDDIKVLVDPRRPDDRCLELVQETMMSEELELMLAERAIQRVLTSYSRGVDRFDFETVRSCYWPDGTDDHGSFVGGIDEFIPFVQKSLNRFERTAHFLGNMQIDVHLGRGVARSETYAVAFHRYTDAEGNPTDMWAGLRYVDRFERRDDQWRIRKRVCAYDWRRTDRAGAGSGFADTYVRGIRSADDIVYRILDE